MQWHIAELQRNLKNGKDLDTERILNHGVWEVDRKVEWYPRAGYITSIIWTGANIHIP